MPSTPEVALPGAFSIIARLAAVAISTFALHVSMTPPNPPPSGNALRKVSTIEHASKRLLRPLMTCFSLAPGMIELAAIAMQLLAPSELDLVSGTCAERISFDVLALAACAMGLVGMGIRLWCYRALGRLFTFELALLPRHELITTGPYALVRHPAYAGGLLVLAGATVANVTKGSWAYECGVVYSGWGAGWGLIVAVSTVVLIDRCQREDDLLREAFREEWDAWSQKARWKMVPWVY